MPVITEDIDSYNACHELNLFKKIMNDKFKIQLLFNFYWGNYLKDDKTLEMHPLIAKKLIKLSENYFIATEKGKSETNEVTNILYKNLIPLDLSAENYLFVKFMKFHLGLSKFSQWYDVNNFSNLEVNELIMKDYLVKGFLVCLDKKKKELKENIQNLTDFKIISNICIKERLTLYNFLVDNLIDQKEAKEFINRHYMKVFRNKIYTPNIYSEVKDKNINDFLIIYSKDYKI